MAAGGASGQILIENSIVRCPLGMNIQTHVLVNQRFGHSVCGGAAQFPPQKILRINVAEQTERNINLKLFL